MFLEKKIKRFPEVNLSLDGKDLISKSFNRKQRPYFPRKNYFKKLRKMKGNKVGISSKCYCNEEKMYYIGVKW